MESNIAKTPSRRRMGVVYFLAILAAIWGVSIIRNREKKPANSKVVAATVAKTAKEEQLNTIVLTAQAVQRLGIVTTPVEVRPVRRTRFCAGEVVLPTGALIIVSAPFTGTLQAAGKEPVPHDGSPLHFGQPIFELMPMLSKEREVLTPSERLRYAEVQHMIATARIDANGLVEQAVVTLENAKLNLERADRLFRGMAGSAKGVDDAKAQVALAEKGLAAAEARKKQVDEIKLEMNGESERPSPLPIVAPHDGIIRVQNAAVGEFVTAGHPLFEVMQCDPIWIKVPVYVGDLAEIDQQAVAKVGSLAGQAGSPQSDAVPVKAPPTATALSSTADLYYELKNPEGQYRPGQRLGVSLSLAGSADQRGVPWSAVEMDIYGGSWVYEMTAENTYVRRRIRILRLIDDWVAFDRGPDVEAKIVVEGVAELSGTEFGFGGK